MFLNVYELRALNTFTNWQNNQAICHQALESSNAKTILIPFVLYISISTSKYNFVKSANFAYFDIKLGDQDKSWAPHKACTICIERLTLDEGFDIQKYVLEFPW